jgi:hypothetical protein
MVRLPPASQRLTEVTFDLVPTDAAAALSDDDLRTNAADSESESESDEDADGDAEADGEAELRPRPTLLARRTTRWRRSACPPSARSTRTTTREEELVSCRPVPAVACVMCPHGHA